MVDRKMARSPLEGLIIYPEGEHLRQTDGGTLPMTQHSPLTDNLRTSPGLCDNEGMKDNPSQAIACYLLGGGGGGGGEGGELG